jgi:excisionase family DNA binding protein
MKLLTPKDVAQQLSISRASVDRLIQSGRLRAVKLSQGQRKATYRVRPEDLERFVAQNMTVAA